MADNQKEKQKVQELTPYKIKEERDKIDPATREIMLDRDGNPQKEEVEITIPALRAVSVFDVSQTDGEPIPQLIVGESKGYFDREARRIAVQENMSESQTLKTMIHELELESAE